MAKRGPKEAREFRFSQLVGQHPDWSFKTINEQVRAEYGAGLRKKDALAVMRSVRANVYSRRAGQRIPDSSEALQPKLRGKKRYAYPVSTPWRGEKRVMATVKFRRALTYSMGRIPKRIKGMNIYLDTMTHSEFVARVKSGWVLQRIEMALSVYLGSVPLYEIDGYWRTKGRV